MLVPIDLLCVRLGAMEELVVEMLKENCVPITRGMVQYQLLPSKMQESLTIPSVSIKGVDQKRMGIALKRQTMLYGWHDYLQKTAAVESEVEWNAYIERQGAAAAIGRGGKIPEWYVARDWWRRYLKEGVAGLCLKSPSDSRNKTTSLTEEQRMLLVSALYHPDPAIRRPHLSIPQLAKYLVAETGSSPSCSSIKRWLRDWEFENRRLVEELINPDKARGSWGTKIGSLSEDVLRLNQRWELDGTKLDVICVDMVRYTISVIIDIYSRRVKCHISKSSTAESIMMLMRDCMVDWGVPEEIVCDNGKDYVADAIVSFCRELAIRRHILPPFYPQGKPHVESFNRRLAKRAELWPGYVGHDVEERKDIENRLSFAARQAGKKVIRAGYSLTEMREALEAWLRDEYHAEDHRSLGCSPNEKAAAYEGKVRRISDVRALDVLLQPAADSRIYRAGYIELDGGKYIPSPPAAAPPQGSHVSVRRGADYGIIYLYNQQGVFVCEAVDAQRLGSDRKAVAGEIKRVAAEKLRQQMRELRKTVKRAAGRDVNDAIADDAKKRRLAKEAEKAQSKVIQVNFRQLPEEHTTPALEEAAKAAASTAARHPQVSNHSPAPIIIDDPGVVYTPPPVDQPKARWKAWQELDAAKKAGKSLCDDALAFYANFQSDPYCKMQIARSRAA